MRVKFNQSAHLRDHTGQHGADYARGVHEVPDHHIGTPYFLALAKDGLVEEAGQAPEAHPSLEHRQKALYDRIADAQAATAKKRPHAEPVRHLGPVPTAFGGKPEGIETPEGSQIPGTASGHRAAELGGREGQMAPPSPTSSEAQALAGQMTDDNPITNAELKDAMDNAGEEDEKRGKKRHR